MGTAGLPWRARPTRVLVHPCVDNDLRLPDLFIEPFHWCVVTSHPLAQPRSRTEMRNLIQFSITIWFHPPPFFFTIDRDIFRQYSVKYATFGPAGQI
jgi:hypothetical protein